MPSDQTVNVISTRARKERVSVYVDGFNLYFGLRSKNWRKYYWLDLVQLSTSLLKPSQELAQVHYFTSRIRDNGTNQADQRRQTNYLDALETRGVVLRHEGHFLSKKVRCNACGAQRDTYEEKQTDVRIATRILGDAIDDRFDTAIVISGDSDLTPPIQEVRTRFGAKRIIVVFPPNRHSAQLKAVANACFTLGEANLRKSQLPETVVTQGGIYLKRPDHWR